MVALGLMVAAGALAASAPAADAPAKQAAFLYVDTVNGSRPVGAKPRPISCTQTNNFKRGEQVVFRIWGSEAATSDVLSSENVKYAYVTVPGLPNMKLNWGPHGAASNRVWFWTAAWVIPPDYPLGTVEVKVVFKTEANTFGRYDYTLTVTPNAVQTAKKGTTRRGIR